MPRLPAIAESQRAASTQYDQRDVGHDVEYQHNDLELRHVLKIGARKIRFLPIRFGSVQPSEPGGTGNLSETGLYVITESPFSPGDPLNLKLRLKTDAIDLRGQVIWMTQEHRVGQPPGMGIVLATPPTDYLDYVRALP